ncbi:hypothetical protein GGS24DRAFT_70962 [Hypoxylon argillaceum]|nr:hypothetical protein GGS24DRAFT_70962 [Hypoxylon argillaceum]
MPFVRLLVALHTRAEARKLPLLGGTAPKVDEYLPPNSTLRIPGQEEIEALRIHGSAGYGFGTLPNVIEYLLIRKGFVFPVINDSIAKVLAWTKDNLKYRGNGGVVGRIEGPSSSTESAVGNRG